MTYFKWKERLDIVCVRKIGLGVGGVLTDADMILAKEYWLNGSTPHEFLTDFMDNNDNTSSMLDDMFDIRNEL